MCIRDRYCAACHCSTTRDVALDAFNSKLFFLGTYFSSLCDPKLHLGRPPRLSLRLPPLTGALHICFVLYTFSKGAVNLTVTTFAQITHIVPPVTVQPLAMWLSMHLIQNFFLWAPIFRVCVTQHCILDGLRGYLFAFCR